jgi:hypothetical protein
LYVVGLLALLGLLLAACGGSEPTAEPDRVATKVAEELAVAATLAALTPQTEPQASPVPPTVTLAPTNTPDVEATVTPILITVDPPAATATATPTPIDVVVDPPATATASPAPTHTATPIPTVTPTPPPPPPPTATSPPPPPSPTPVLIAVLPVDGGGDDTLNISNNNPAKQGRNITLPGFSPNEASQPMVFRNRMVFQAEVMDKNVGNYDGAGIDNVRFTIDDDRGRQVHFRQENNAGYCVFGGGEPDCNVLRFAESGYRWPDGETLFPVFYNVTIDIQPKNGNAVTWVWSYKVELPHDGARINNISVQGGSYVIDFQTFGFAPQVPGQHVHFFFNTVSSDQAGVPGGGPWKLYGGSSPFTEYSVAERPPGADKMCILVANPDHSIPPHTGNCFPLP